ncbi:unnamed protein product [Hermetia illucens]|uniref:DUF4758 domain-containing protein n=2 Tax=Hermetia illucens TaxID=343691 RepID=A0A7R8Z1W4_HERIL|nr:unnamed protein product [Hermetia illucens]
MLQPRAQRQQIQSLGSFCISICIIFICIESGLGQNSDVYIVEPTPALRLNSQDLTTILLLNNNNNNNNQGNLGRHYHNNVKPTVGLLTSTARTFIQEGVTTEYATQVLGTTLDNGRLYAQLLKKSSRVLYDKDKVSIAPTAKFPGIVPTFSAKSPKSLLQSHNDIIGDKDWQLIDDHLLLVNKDSINEKNPAQNSEVSQTGNSLLVFPVKKYPNFDEETSNAPRFSNQSFSFSQSSSSTSFSSDEGTNISPQKVLRADNLPTYTIKNVFAPSGFSWDSPLDDTYIVNEKFDRASKFHVDQQPQQRTPKVLQHNTKILNNELRSMATVTYYGFADFTTVVGDTVIIFSPSTSTGIGNQGQVTSIKGEATLNGIPQETAFVTHVPITVTQDIIEPTFTMQHVVGSVPPTGSTDSFQPQENTSEVLSDERDQTELTMPEESEDYNSDDDSSTEEYMTATQDEASEETITTTTPKIPEEPPTEPKVIELEPSIVTLEETQTSSTLTPTETQTKAMLSTPSNEDISKIFASLASVEAAKKLAAEKSQAEMEMNEEEQTQTTTENVVIEIPTVTSAIPTTLSGEILENTDGQKPQSSTEKNEQIETTSENISNNEMPTEAVVEVESDVMPNKPSAEIATETEKDVESISPETKVSGGVTTIFFEDDPFLGIDATQIEKIPPLTTSLLPTNDESNLETTTGNAEQLETTTMEPEVDEPEAQTEHSANNDAVYRVEGDSHECQQKTSEIIPTLVPKTLTYLTTFFISDTEQTSTSIESNVVVTFDVSYSTKLFCEEIISSRVVEQVFSTKTESEGALTVDSSSSDEPSIDETDLASSVPQIKEDSSMIITTPRMIVTEKAHVTTEQTPATEGPEHTEDNENGDEENPEEDSEEESTYDNTSEQSGEEIELIYKTLYTTYTYLTTFFHESTTSISSRKEIITNVITSTVNPSLLQSNDVTKLLESIAPSTIVETSENTSTEIITDKTPVAQSDLVRIDNILREDEEHLSTTPSLSDQDIQPSGVKTYYTTYTYFTTIFVDGETEITSRTEIYTNYVTESDSNLDKSSQIEDRKEYIVSDDDNKIVNDITPTRMHHQPVQTNSVRLVQQALSELSTRENHNVIESSFVSAPVSSSPDENEITMVTDIKSSSSDGDRHIIENINKHWNGLLEDQISSESNTEEIIPSSTLLLQTSYTTFTYFTTMYVGNTASSILSRLETITNVVTETLQPTQMLKVEDSTLPITYFTTFTYWTTLYKDGEITTISREQTVSNIVTPTAAGSQIENSEATQSLVALEETITPSSAVEIGSIYLTETVAPQSAIKVVENITNEVSTLTSAKILEPTTFYTTYTYFTTQYIGEETVINSRFETVTNVNTPLGQAAILEATVAQPVSTSSSITPSALDTETTTPSVLTTDEEIIEINHGKIVDAEGISTLLYTTKTIATSINDLRTTVVQSTSLLNVDEVKKASISSSQIDSSTRTYKTGLVRLIDGTIIANSTTTLYQSKVIGTIIDGRYAQIIESTSSFLVEKTLAPSTPVLDISPTAVQPSSVDVVLQTTFVPTTSPDAIESSINDGPEDKTQDEEENDESDDESETAVDESGRPKSRLTFQTKKKTFTPVIRPFASRNRPQFAPKRKNAAPGSATIITRSDFTPTITATPALKSEGGKGRFSSNRKGSSVILSSGVISGSSRKFSRPGGSSSRGFYSSSAYPSGSRRGFASSKIQPTASSYFGGSSRRGGASSQRGIAGSSNFGRLGSSSIYPGNSRLRIKPSSIIPTADVQSITNLYTTQEPDTNEESATLFVTDQEGGQDQEEIEITTESQRRPNSLLKFRRPPIVAKNLPVSQRRNPLTQRSKPVTTTTSTTPKPQPRSFQRPSIAPFGSRPRAQLGLFPPRTLFKPQNINDDLHETRKQDDDGNDFGDDLEGDEYDDDDEEIDDEELDRNRRNNIKRHVRTKRQAPGFRNRFRRPPAASKHEEKADVVEEEPVTQRSRTTARFSGSRNNNKKSSTQSKNNNGNSRIRPTKASSSTRAQFTLREKDTATKPSRSSSFRRPSNNGSPTSRRTSTTIGRPKAPRLKSFSNSVTESTHSSRSTAGRSRQTTSRGRSTTRSRGTTEYKNIDPVLPIFDGTITVTHHIPTEVTIPVVNGKVTEYKNIVTAQIRTEVLAPNQYNTLVDRAGSSLLVLAREDSTINSNGATEVTQFILHETPTTSVIFTPTTIRGRRTSFSHVIPSTVYDVENVVSTIQPQIAAQAPLANILLSQLLLGNIGLPQQQLNPLIGLGGQTGVPGTPVTEFKTRTTTYVTTVTEGMSTVIPLTFRGKEILTTIFDSTVNVITATEFITDTVVVTPTAAAVQQVNSLLLPLLLQQQAQGAQPVLPIQNSALPQQIINDPLLNNVPSQHQNLFQDNSFGLDSNRIQKVNLDDFHETREAEQFPEQETFREAATETTRSSRKRHHRKGNKHANGAAATPEPQPPMQTLETSVVTLYVSGRRPGEFSTILSTVVGQEGSLRKRSAEFAPVEKSAIVDYGDLYRPDESEIKEYLLPATDDAGLIVSSQTPTETQSLESIVGDVSRWFESQSDTSINNRSPSTATTEFIPKTTTQVTVPEEQSQRLKEQSNDQHFLA